MRCRARTRPCHESDGSSSRGVLITCSNGAIGGSGHSPAITTTGRTLLIGERCHQSVADRRAVRRVPSALRGFDNRAYCLMPDHVHLIAVPDSEDGLRRGIGEAHHRYRRWVNFRKRWRGHLWLGRFASLVLDDHYLLAATRYVEVHPVRGRMVARPQAYPWSSPSAHRKRRDDVLVKSATLLEMIGDWRAFLPQPRADESGQELRHHKRTGRPLGVESSLTNLEGQLNGVLKPTMPGRQPKSREK